MPFQYDTFVYDYESFDYVKDILDPKRFFTMIDKFVPGVESSYTDSDDYTYYKYLDDNDKDGYLASKDFVYKLNKDFFRGDHFLKLSSKDYNIVTLGCSYTFGHGLPEEYTWPNVLNKSIGEINKNSKLFNLGSPGLGIDALINNLVVFINKYGVPDAIFALWPDMNRHVAYHPNKKEYRINIPNLDHLRNRRDDRFLFDKVRNYVFEDRIYNHINQIRFLELLCKAYKIKLIWHSWPGIDVPLYSQLSFENYVYWASDPYANSSTELEHEVEDKYLTYGGSARDRVHPGIGYNIEISKMFFSKWQEND